MRRFTVSPTRSEGALRANELLTTIASVKSGRIGYDGLTDQDQKDGRGLLEADGTKRPAYAAFKHG